MAKEFIEPPQEEECVQWSSQQDGNDTRENTQVSQPEAKAQAKPNVSTPEEKDIDIVYEETLSTPSSQENIPPHFPSSSLPLSPVLVSPSSLPPLPSPLSSQYSSHPSLPSSSSPLLSPPAHPHQRRTNISVEEFNERAMQDSENNNVDENSNDQQYDLYADYHQEFSHHQFVPDQSVRPRDRRPQSERDQPDCTNMNNEDSYRRRRSRFSHRRNLSEDQTYSGASYAFEDNHSYLPPLPNLTTRPGAIDRKGFQENLQHCQTRISTQSHSQKLPLNLRGGGYDPLPPLPAPSEDITQGAQELLMNFTYDTLQSNHLEVPESFIMHRGFSNPTWSRAGQELQKLADAFAKTEERRRVQVMAKSVNLRSMNMENFFELCAELFSDGITRERIVALFTFVGDVAVHQVRLRGEEFLQLLMKWSLKYLVDNICRWVQAAGGWVVVLCCGANMLYKGTILAFCIVGTLAAGLFIYKTLKDW